MKNLKSLTVKQLKAPLFIAWQINAECNLGCLHCCEEAGHSLPDEMNSDEILNFCQQVVDLEIPYVAISGGEPLLHPEFFKVCEFLSRNNINVKVETNGEFIDEEVADRISKLNFRSVQISWDGATASTHEKLRMGGNWKKVMTASRLLVKKGINTEVVFVPTKFNIHEIGDIVDIAYSSGIYGVYTGKIMRIGRAAKNWDILCPSDEEYEKFFEILKGKTAEYDGRMKVYYYPYDVIEELKYRLEYPSASLLVIPNGKVKLIGPLPFICGDLKKENLKQVWMRYLKAWGNPRVIKYTRNVIAHPELLAESNKWIEVF